MKGSWHGLPWMNLWGINHIGAQHRRISSLFKVGDIWRVQMCWSLKLPKAEPRPPTCKKEDSSPSASESQSLRTKGFKGTHQLLRAQLDSISNANSSVEGSKWGIQIVPQMQVQEGSEPNHQHAARTEQAQLRIHLTSNQWHQLRERAVWGVMDTLAGTLFTA